MLVINEINYARVPNSSTALTHYMFKANIVVKN